jgi:hypothetical protein
MKIIKAALLLLIMTPTPTQKKMKHVDIQLHFIQEVIKKKKLALIHTPTNKMLANFFTKAIPCPALAKSLQNLGLFCLERRGGNEI